MGGTSPGHRAVTRELPPDLHTRGDTPGSKPTGSCRVKKHLEVDKKQVSEVAAALLRAAEVAPTRMGRGLAWRAVGDSHQATRSCQLWLLALHEEGAERV